MNIILCKILINIAKYQSISKAAEAVYLSQSAVSQQIKSLEKSLGVKLLERAYNGVKLTEFGQLALQHAQEMLSSYNKLLLDITEKQQQKRSLKILSTPVIYSYALPCTLYDLKKYFPKLELEIETLPSSLIEEQLQQQVGDIGFIVGAPHSKKLSYKKILTDDVVLVASTAMDIPDQISCQELTHYQLILPSHACKSRDVIDAHLTKIALDFNQLKVLYELDSTESMKISVLQGYGLAFMPYMGIKKELYTKQLKIVTLKGYFLCNHYYLIRSQEKNSVDDEYNQIISYIENMFNQTVC